MSVEITLDDINTILKRRGIEPRGKVQKFIDSEVLRLSKPYIPLRTGTLISSGEFGTVLGSGTVKWNAPYAKSQYYSKRSPGRHNGKLRGAYWFERMKNARGQEIIDGAARMAGGKHE